MYKIYMFMQCAPDPYELFQSIFGLRADAEIDCSCGSHTPRLIPTNTTPLQESTHRAPSAITRLDEVVSIYLFAAACKLVASNRHHTHTHTQREREREKENDVGRGLVGERRLVGVRSHRVGTSLALGRRSLTI